MALKIFIHLSSIYISVYLSIYVCMYQICTGSLVFISEAVTPVPDSDGDGAIFGRLPWQQQGLLTPPRQLPSVWPADIVVCLHSHVLHLQFTPSPERDPRMRQSAPVVAEIARELPNVICDLQKGDNISVMKSV